jgi:DnaK suppressor protein
MPGTTASTPKKVAPAKAPVGDVEVKAAPAPSAKAKEKAQATEKAHAADKAHADKATAKPTPARHESRKAAAGYAGDHKFLGAQRRALEEERSTYMEQARSLRAEADSLVEEMEPGDIQFDEESGEGGTVTVDRERDLALSAQALVAVEEIDHAVAKIELGTYGICEGCGTLIPKNRLEALPYARLCIACKSGGLSRR